MAKKNNRVIKYKKSRNINIGVVIFAIAFIYIAINVFLYFTKPRITIYEVVEGQSSENLNSSVNGLILRNESVTYASKRGYVYYFLPELSQVAVGTNLYTIDENGTVASIIEESLENDENLSDENLEALKEEIYNFTTQFSPLDFDSVYDFKYALEASIIEKYNILNSDNEASGLFEIIKADKTGTVLYYTDNYESLTIETVSDDDFNNSNYKKTKIQANDLIEKDSPIYKTVISEEWSILIPLSEDEEAKYLETTSLSIMFLNDKVMANASFEIVHNSNGTYGVLNLDKYCIRYLQNRYIDFKILESETTGLKIPKSSVTEKEFYKIPLGYLTKGGNDDEVGVNKEVYTESGEMSVQFVTIDIYSQDDEYCYVDKESFESGDVLVMNESDTRYQISETSSLKGVYNVNNGYAQFRKVEIELGSNDYYIIKIDTAYGLSLYDHIVLNASMVKENQVIYQ